MYKELKKYNVILEGIVDSDKSKKGMKFEEFIVMSIDDMVEVCNKKDIYVLVASHFGLENMVHTLFKYRIEKIGIIC